MRRLVLSALVLLPVLASAQTSTSTASQSSATLQAKSATPAGLPPAPAAASPRAADLMVPVHQTVIDENSDNSTPGYNSTAQHLSAPRLLHAVPLELSLQDMRSEPDTTTIVVNIVVTADGKPTNITIAHSGGAALDQRAIAAVTQYLFQPATEGHIAVASTATVSFKLKKS
ncbi:MAG: TonB family protein [Acidobacteriota bacterium]